MNQTGGPDKLILQMKSLNGTTDGFRITSTLKSGCPTLLLEFRPFKDFLISGAKVIGLKRSGEFYFNYPTSGFTGIVCFNGSFLSLRTLPRESQINFEIFVSDRMLNNIYISEDLYRNTVEFFESKVIEEVYQSL